MILIETSLYIFTIFFSLTFINQFHFIFQKRTILLIFAIELLSLVINIFYPFMTYLFISISLAFLLYIFYSIRIVDLIFINLLVQTLIITLISVNKLPLLVNELIYLVGVIIISLVRKYIKKEWIQLFLIIQLFIVYILVKQLIVTDFYMLIMILTFILVNAMVLYLYIQSIKQENETLIIQKQMEINQVYVENMIKNYQNIRKIKHDIHAYDIAINGYIKNKEYDKIEKLINERQSKYQIKTIYQTNNPIIDSITNYFYEKCRENNIQFEFEYFISKKIKLSDLDYMTIYYNLLNNAYEATLECIDKKIKVSIYEKMGIYIIKIENTYNQNKPLTLETNKNKENHGIGLNNVKETLANYKHDYTYSTKDDVVICKVCLYDIFEML